jgi:hypothetical protein
VIGLAGATFPDHRLNPKRGKELRYVFGLEFRSRANTKEPLIDCYQKTYRLTCESAAATAAGRLGAPERA